MQGWDSEKPIYTETANPHDVLAKEAMDMAIDRKQSDQEFVAAVTDQPGSDESARPSDAELDALPEYVLDDRRDILWQLCEDGQYTMLATSDPVLLDREDTRSLAQLRATVGSVLVPLRADERARDARTGLLSESPQ